MAKVSIIAEVPPGSYDAVNIPNGIVYKDVNNYLVELYKMADLATLGLNKNGSPDATIDKKAKLTADQVKKLIQKHIIISWVDSEFGESDQEDAESNRTGDFG